MAVRRRVKRPLVWQSESTTGSWNVHGGFEFLSLGDTPEAFNGGDRQKLIGSIGIGFSY